MLRKLSIHNYAIIEELELSFSNELTVITGETGAGKSIVMEALSLVLGERADTAVLFEKDKKCVVEAEFSTDHLDLQSFFLQNDLDEGSELVLRREISAAGKSRAFINDTPVNLSVMKVLGDSLVDMHQQHESQEISTAQFQLSLLDSLAQHETTIAAYKKQFQEYREKLSRWKTLHDQHLKETQELDYLNFQLSELSNATLKENEQETLEQEQQQLEHAEEILKNYSVVLNQLKESEDAITPRLRDLQYTLSSVQKYFTSAAEILKRIESARLELEDIANEIENQQQEIVADPDRLTEVQQRLDLIYRLQKKHRVTDVNALLKIADEFDQKISSISIHTEELEELANETAAQKNILITAARKFRASG